MILKYLILTIKRRAHNTSTHEAIFWAFTVIIAVGFSIYFLNSRQHFYVYCIENYSETRFINSFPIPIQDIQPAPIQNIQPQVVINNYEAIHPRVLRGNFFIGIAVGVAVGMVAFALFWAVSVKINCP